MLLHDFAYVPVGAGHVRDRLLANRGEWLSPLASAAASDGESLRLRIGPSDALPALAKTVRVTVGEPLERAASFEVERSAESVSLYGAYLRSIAFTASNMAM